MAATGMNEKTASSSASLDGDQHVENGTIGVQCPPGTTERKIMMKVDLHVVPWLAIMYTLAFLGELSLCSTRRFGDETC